jgi:1-acyl-sn-glycerol-3-phosphate acyltransferase
MALKRYTIFYFICKTIIIILSKIYWRLSAKGRENIPKEGGVLLVANHASYLDPPLIGSYSTRPVNILAKSELFKIPIFNLIIKALGAIPIRREMIDRKSLRIAVDLLKDGCVLLVFPEGTRTRNGSIGNPKPGSGLIAKMADVAIVPVYIQGSYETLPRRRIFPKPNKIKIHFGKSFTISDSGYDVKEKDFVYILSNFMIDKIKELKEKINKEQ